MNDRLFARVHTVGSCDGLLPLAMRHNRLFAAHGHPKGPLEDVEVYAIVATVWADREKSIPLAGHRGTARTDADEVRCKALSDAAYRLLMLFRTEHNARMERGEGFAISPKAMAIDECLPGWGHCRYRDARDELKHAGFIELAVKGTTDRGGRMPDQWRLTPRALTPSLAAKNAIELDE